MNILLAVAVFLLPCSIVLAQEVPSLTAGTRLRITVINPRLGVEIGLYRALTDTTLTILKGSSTRVLPLSEINRLEWSRGRRPSLLGGMLGFVVGVAVGGVVGCVLNRDSYGVFCTGQNDTKVVVVAGLGGGVGAVLGAMLFRGDRWQAVDLAQLHSIPR